MVSLPQMARQKDEALLESRRLLGSSKELVAASREHIARSQALIDRSFLLLASLPRQLVLASFSDAPAPAKILIVDDDRVNLSAIGKFLELDGFYTERAGDGVEALEKLHRSRFNLVLSDIRMPRMNGLELAREVRANFASTPIGLMTADLPDNPAELAAQVGAAHIMSKIPLDNLLEKIRQTGKRHH